LARDLRHEQLIQCNKLWNELRQDDTTEERRLGLCAEILAFLKSKLVDYSQRPDTSRVIQSCFKFGSPEIRSQILDEIQGHFVSMCKGKHSSFLMVVMLRHGGEKDRARILAELRPHARALGTHGSGARVVNFALSSENVFASPRDKERFVEMFYGNELLLQGANESGLADKMAKAKPAALSSMKQALNKMADKGLLRFPYAQRLMHEFLTVCTADEVREMIPSVREASLAMVGTWEGAQAVTLVLVAADAKERKRLVKEWKGHIVDLAVHQFAWLVVAKSVRVIDDTVLTAKSILEEMTDDQSKLLALVLQREGHARKVLLSAIAPEERAKTYFEDAEKLALFRDEPHSTSVKPAALRQAEVCAKLVPALLSCLALEDLAVLTAEGSRTLPLDVLRECLAWTGGVDLEQRATLCNLLAEKAEAFLEDVKVHLILKRILKDEAEMNPVPPASFGQALATKLKGKLNSLTEISRACFVLEALLNHPHGAKMVKQELKIAKFGDGAGCNALKAALAGGKKM